MRILRKSAPVMALIGAFALSGCSLLPAGRSAPDGQTSASSATRAPPVARGPVVRSPDTARCIANLDNVGAKFSPVPDRYYGAGCSVLGSVQLNALQGDTSDFGLSNIGPITCPLAEATAGWARYGVDRAARQILGSGLLRIETFGSYSCRNIAGSGRRSSHSSAEAVDVSAFVLKDGRRIVLAEDWNGSDPRRRQFLRIVQQSACKRFGTVLGPEYNAAHSDHFHIERTGNSFCR